MIALEVLTFMGGHVDFFFGIAVGFFITLLI